MNEHTGTNRPYNAEPAAVADVDTVAAGDAGQDDETVELRAEIAQTQADLSETINAIQDKLNPHTMMDRAKDTARETATDIATQAKETVREATIGKAEHMVSDVGETARGTGSSIMETIRQNPLPAALAAIGVGWLWMNRAKGTSDGNGSYRGSTRPSYEAYGTYRTAAPYGEWRSGYDDSASGTSGAQDAVRQGMQQAQDTAGRLANQAQTGASILATGTQQQAQRAQGQLQQMLQETPLAVGGIALALGAAVGLAIPETPPEHQLMGEARDTLMQKAQESAQDTMQKVQGVAQKVGSTAIDTAKQEAQQQGLTGQ